MNFELDELPKNGTWKFVYFPYHVMPRGSKQFYKLKNKDDGPIERYKTKFVAKRYNQVMVLDFFDNFSHVAKLSTIRPLNFKILLEI